ncbi:hypothetical protein HY386_02335 [Candidatus Daviesbacteria bacterium]|nr:hypothetical protein [Candidatus Daviesbacteria bacterium]
MHIKLSASYLHALKGFVKGNQRNAESTKKAIRLFKQNPRHPSLNLEKLQGLKVWTIRINKGNRIFFIWLDESTALFIDIGKHDKYKKY